MRGIGEPIWHERSPAELIECQLHESLLNTAFADAAGFQLLCPYDTTTLDRAVLHEARCSHPAVSEDDVCRDSRHFRGVAGCCRRPTRRCRARRSARAPWRSASRRCAMCARPSATRRRGGPSGPRRRDVTAAVHELATNSIRHGGGLGVMRVWEDHEGLRAEVKDRGRIDDPLCGRRAPEPGQAGGWGLWIANRTCDLVQVRTSGEGTVIRVLMRRG